MRINKRSQYRKKTLPIIATLILLICACGAYAYGSLRSTPVAQNSANKDSSIDHSAEERVKNGGGSGQGTESAASGGVVDTGGKNVTTQSGGTTSKSGNLTLYTPLPNTTISKNVTVKGFSKTSLVYYRINDTVRGMIGSGQLSVNNGHFSGVLSVNTTAPNGSIEVYSLDSNGREINNISIDVKYS